MGSTGHHKEMAANNNEYQTEEIHWLTSEFYGLIIGQGGSTVNNIRRLSGADVIIDSEETGISFLIGNQEEREIARRMIEDIIDESYGDNFLNPNFRKFFYIAGNPKSILIVESPHVPSLSCLRNPPSLVDENETAQQEVADLLLEAFQITKNEQNKMARTGTGELPSPVAKYLVHAGRMFSNLQPRTYPSQSQRFQKSLYYQRLTPADLDIVKMASLPKINEYSRYDLRIVTPRPFYSIRYKIFLAQKKEGGSGEICFIPNEEAGVNENEFRSIREGPGYFSTSDVRTSAINLIDPENGMTTRVDTLIYDFLLPSI